VRILPRRGPGLRCCFRRRNGPLLTSPAQPGGFLSRNPLFFGVPEDEDAYENCCLLSDLCWAYTSLRPKQNGRFYRPRRPGNSYKSCLVRIDQWRVENREAHFHKFVLCIINFFLLKSIVF
jgi:hypothetical protein